MIDLYIAKSLAVSFGVEDYSGLYEVIWGLNSQYPEINQETKVRAADRAMRSLLDMGHVRFHSGPEGPTEETMPTVKALGVLDDPAVWKPPLERSGLPLYWFTATDAGGDALERGEYSSL
ncbi:hypothetical protein [Rubricoccus marinus]|uniref:Uncharacterized protein n=1 Tax=Rubricoccus marinus TaxID=716817 RepID=A0A259TVL1_9BACT|nr:hypothetical protein [Rubricoccus marinus]OZC01614.1 hypothetical protein BSZ36_00620 [Rubricoccus marinus]